MNVRNLNDANDRYVGSVYGGVLGSSVPSTGTDGPGFIYPLIQADSSLATKRVRGKITRFPSTGTLLANDDTSFTYTRTGQGTESFDFQPLVDGVEFGPQKTINLVVGTPTPTPGGKSVMVRLINWLRRVGF